MTKKTVFCPLCGREVTGDECFDISMVAEGTTPDRFLPNDIKPEQVKASENTCLKCKYHPE